jgi:hypothetical protein
MLPAIGFGKRMRPRVIDGVPPSASSPYPLQTAAITSADLASTDTQRRLQKLQVRGLKYVAHAGHLFTQSNGVISAQAPASGQVQLNLRDCGMLFQKLGGMMVRWTDGFREGNEPTEWYSVICRRPLELEEFPKKKRYTLRKSLEQCSARRMTAEELAESGYEVYVQALKSYGTRSTKILPPSGFRQSVSREKDFPDLVHNWGVYHGNTLIGYAQNQVFGREEVNYSTIKLNPAFLKFSPGYALVHTMNRHYLTEGGFAYVNEGFRSVSHETNIQSWLLDTFGFEKAYTTLHLHYRLPLRILIRLAYPFRGVVGARNPRLGAMLECERCHRSCSAGVDRRPAPGL